MSGDSYELGLLCDSPLRAALREPSQEPLREVLGHDLEETGIVRIWSKISTGEARAQKTWFERLGIDRPVFWVLAASLLAGLLLLVQFSGSGPLLLGDDRSISSALTNEALGGGLRVDEELSNQEHLGVIRVKLLQLGDGSRITTFGAAELAVLSNDGETFVTSLRSGKVEFYVQPGGPRRWLIEAGAVSVEVVGTHFVVERSKTNTIVSVKKGVVLVRGNVPGGLVRLGAGESVTAQPRTSPTFEEQESEQRSVDAGVQERVFTLDELPFEEDESSEPQIEDDFAQEKTVARPSNDKVRAVVSDDLVSDDLVSDDLLEGLLGQADVARTAEAARLFYQVVERASAGDARMGIAALSFARLSGDPSTVLKVLNRGLAAIPMGLREPALARIVKAHTQLGDQKMAKQTAKVYLGEFPEGARVDLVKKWAGL